MSRIKVSDAITFLTSISENVAMVYIDPPYGHGSFNQDPSWVFKALEISEILMHPTGIAYLHVDPQFVKEFHDKLPWRIFRGQIVWKTGWISGFKSKTKRFWPRNHQLILGFAAPGWSLRPVKRPMEEYMGRTPDWDGERWDGQKRNGKGFFYDDIWVNINPVDIMSWSKEKVGYPTQKPIALLERLILGSTDEGDLVLDPCCGSGTALIAARNLSRRYAGCDISRQAVEITNKRLSA